MSHGHRHGFRRIWWVPPLPTGARVCEIGFGPGAFVREAVARGWQMSGMDPAAPLPDAGDAFQTCRAEDYAWPTEPTYDAVVGWQTVEHLDEPLRVMRAVLRALHPRGYFVLALPNRRCLERWLWGPHWDGWRPGAHRNHWTARELTGLLRDVGFAIQAVLYQRCAKQLPGGLVTGTLLAALHLSSRMTIVARRP